MSTRVVIVSGTILMDHYRWLQHNAYTDEKGRLRCIATDEPMYGQTHHRERPQGSGATVPFTETCDARTAEMISFKSYGCDRCKAGLPVPEAVTFADIVVVRESA